jgi:hypothetical protein
MEPVRSCSFTGERQNGLAASPGRFQAGKHGIIERGLRVRRQASLRRLIRGRKARVGPPAPRRCYFFWVTSLLLEDGFEVNGRILIILVGVSALVAAIVAITTVAS